MAKFICQICGSSECLPYFVKADSRSIDKTHQYVQCSRCRVVGLYPLPTSAELEELYETVHHKPHFHRNQKAYFAEFCCALLDSLGGREHKGVDSRHIQKGLG